MSLVPDVLYILVRPSLQGEIKRDGIVVKEGSYVGLSPSIDHILTQRWQHVARSMTGEVEEREFEDPTGALKKAILDGESNLNIRDDGVIFGHAPVIEENDTGCLVTVNGSMLNEGAFIVGEWRELIATLDYLSYKRSIPKRAILDIQIIDLPNKEKASEPA